MRMKQFEVTTLEMEEMSIHEMEMVNGGIPWGRIAKYVLKFLGEVAAGWGIEKILDWYFDNIEDEEVEEFYGGELDPAICEG